MFMAYAHASDMLLARICVPSAPCSDWISTLRLLPISLSTTLIARKIQNTRPLIVFCLVTSPLVPFLPPICGLSGPTCVGETLRR